MIKNWRKGVLYFVMIVFWIFLVGSVISYITKMRWILVVTVILGPIIGLVYILTGGEKMVKKKDLEMELEELKKQLSDKQKVVDMENSKQIPVPRPPAHIREPIPREPIRVVEEKNDLSFETEEPKKAVDEDMEEMRRLSRIKQIKARENEIAKESYDLQREKQELLKDLL